MYTKAQCLYSLITEILDTHGGVMTPSQIKEELPYEISNPYLYRIIKDMYFKSIIHGLGDRGYMGNQNYLEYHVDEEEIIKTLGEKTK